MPRDASSIGTTHAGARYAMLRLHFRGKSAKEHTVEINDLGEASQRERFHPDRFATLVVAALLGHEDEAVALDHRA
jgi:hypothetical protein